MARLPAIDNLRRQLEQFRQEASGDDVSFRGITFIARTVEESGAKAGQQGIDKGVFNQFIANTAPRLFKFNASDFAPSTDHALPEIHEFINYGGWSYEITHTDLASAGDEAFAILCYTLKAIYPTGMLPVQAKFNQTLGAFTLTATGTVT